MFPIDKLTYVLTFKGRVLTTVHTREEVRRYLFEECSIRAKNLLDIEIEVYQGSNVVHSLRINDFKFLEKKEINYTTRDGTNFLFLNFVEYKEGGI